MDSLVANVTTTTEEATWNTFEQFLWDWEGPLLKFEENCFYFAVVFSALGLITAVNLRTGTSTMPFLVLIGLSDTVNMTGYAIFSNSFLVESKFI